MNNKQIKKLALSLAKSETEDEVVKILSKAHLWDDISAWKEFDGSEGNWSTIGNQQCTADGALVEKIINSVDAVLIRECLKSGIDPESFDAPSSIQEAQQTRVILREIPMNNRQKTIKRLARIGEQLPNNRNVSMQNRNNMGPGAHLVRTCLQRTKKTSFA